MIIEDLKGKKLERYRPIFIRRKDGRQERADYPVHLFPSEVVAKQIEQSTPSIIVMYEKF